MIKELEQLEKVRKRLGLTQTDVANQLGVSRKTVWRWLHNRHSPSAEHIVEIRDWLEERKDTEL